ncbi:GrpB family protein [Myxococcus qinghaiensis]|uniref:GrpB family protein n=1 Tax=Myxococcus qinghaiensis TaxID=2906758 RepID=UPI0020A77C05|nr:GrpB family protein [Myxococcus qinghaiensis]MCP3167788.1 GrpB family protein [Myxococcus qinghaiensis]
MTADTTASREEEHEVPPPIRVTLVPHDPRWAEAAATEARYLTDALGSIVLRVHHVGSTAIPGIRAKPILDLMPVLTSVDELDKHQGVLEGLGYAGWGELGMPGRRYCTKDDPRTRERLVQLHCYADGSPEISRHLAFRDYLRERPGIARAYDDEKVRCQRLHPNDSHAYSGCKDAWIKRIEAEALAFYQTR